MLGIHRNSGNHSGILEINTFLGSFSWVTSQCYRKHFFHLHSVALYEPLMNTHSSLSSSKVRYWQTWDQWENQGLSYHHNPFVLCSGYVVLKIGDTRKKKSYNPQDSPNTGDSFNKSTEDKEPSTMQVLKGWLNTGHRDKPLRSVYWIAPVQGCLGSNFYKWKGEPRKTFHTWKYFLIVGTDCSSVHSSYFQHPLFINRIQKQLLKMRLNLSAQQSLTGPACLQLARLKGSPKYENRLVFSMLLHLSPSRGSSLVLTQSEQDFLCLQSLHSHFLGTSPCPLD